MSNSITQSKLMLACLCFSASSLAQETIEVIEVTSHYKVQSLYEIGAPISHLSEDDINNAQLKGVSDLQYMIPGLSNGDFNLGQPQYYIRGIGSNADAASAESSISYYLNDIYHGRTATMNVPLFDIERVEVLKGPQGTYQGKNALAGSIKVYSKQAEFDDYSILGAALMERNGSQLLAITNRELNSELAGRLSLFFERQDGYMENPVTNTSFNDQKTKAARASLQYQGEQWLHNLILAYSEETSTNAGQRSIGGLFGQNLTEQYPDLAKDFYSTNEIKQGDTTRELSNLSYHGNRHSEKFSQYINIGYHCHDFINFDSPAPGIIGVDPFNILNNVNEDGCQLGGNFVHTSLSEHPWSAGFYLDYEDTKRIEEVIFDLGVFRNKGAAIEKNLTQHASFFLTKQWQLTDALSVNLGGRYNYDHKKANIKVTDVDQFAYFEPYHLRASLTHKVFTPHLHFNYQFSNNQIAYFNIDTGYKAGGFQPAATHDLAQEPFKKEDAINAELGIKWLSEDQDKSLIINTFRSKFDNLQVLVQRPDPERLITGVVTENAAKAESKGVEIEYQHFFDQLTLQFNLAYLDGQYTDYVDRDDVIGNQLRNAPKWSYSLLLNYHFSPWQDFEPTLSLLYSFKDKTYQDIENYPPSAINQVKLTNLVFALENESTRIAFTVNNLFDQKYYQHNFALPTGVGTFGTFPAPAPPRTLGINFNYQF